LTPTPDALELLVESDIVTCRQAVRRLTQSLRFSLVDQTRMITAASELARNTLVYGGGGEMRWAVVQRDACAGLRLDFEDHGPGIADLELALTDGWTSGGGMGLGLSGSKRLVHDFAIRSAVGEGTCVTITRWS
jgi:serine/threonine-protein kinase RsbT